MGRRVLITGLDSFWGGRMAQALESDPEVEMILGMGTREPTVPLERTEFVRADQTYSILSRIVRATQVDTIVHTFLVVDSTRVPGRALHEINVIGTMNLLAAAGQAGSPVRQVVVKSSTLVYGSASTDPAWFREEMPRTSPARSRVERSLLEVEGLVRDFAEDNPATVVVGAPLRQRARDRHRHADQLQPLAAPVPGGRRASTLSSSSSRRTTSSRCLEHVTRHRIPGLYNVAGVGQAPLERGGRDLRHPSASRCRPWPRATVAAPLVRLGLIEFPPELESLLRYGRGVDTTRIATAGF